MNNVSKSIFFFKRVVSRNVVNIRKKEMNHNAPVEYQYRRIMGKTRRHRTRNETIRRSLKINSWWSCWTEVAKEVGTCEWVDDGRKMKQFLEVKLKGQRVRGSPKGMTYIIYSEIGTGRREFTGEESNTHDRQMLTTTRCWEADKEEEHDNEKQWT